VRRAREGTFGVTPAALKDEHAAAGPFLAEAARTDGSAESGANYDGLIFFSMVVSVAEWAERRWRG